MTNKPPAKNPIKTPVFNKRECVLIFSLLSQAQVGIEGARPFATAHEKLSKYVKLLQVEEERKNAK